MFTSVSEIQQKFGLTDTDINIIRKQLIHMLAQNHPDKNDGKTGAKYFEIQDAINYIDAEIEDTNKQTLSISIRDLSSIIKAAVGNSIVSTEEYSREKVLCDQVDHFISTYRSPIQTPAIASSSILGVLSGLFLMPKTITEHPTLSQYIDLNSPLFLYIWLSLVITTALLWLLKSYSEKLIKNKISYIKSEHGRSEIFHLFINHLQWTNASSRINASNSLRFRKHDLTNEILHYFGLYRDTYIISRLRSIDYSIIENTADIIINTAIQKSIITKIDTIDFHDTYEINPDYIKHML